MKLKLILGLVLVSLNLAADARFVRKWSDAELQQASDLIVIGRPITVRDLDESKFFEGFQASFRGIETTFKISDVMKGVLESDHIVLHHYRERGTGFPGMANQPGFVSFRPDGTNEYVLYLVKDGNYRHAPATGQVDADLSIKLLPLKPITEEIIPSVPAAVTKVKLKFVKVDSEETDSQNGYGRNAVDANPNTYWHTQWHGNSPGLPHEIIIELLPPSVIKGFSYLPRQDESDHGSIKDYEFYVSDDGTNYGQPVKKGAFEPGKEEKIEIFKPIKCHFIKLRATSEINGLPWTSAAEIRVFQSGEAASAEDYWRGDIEQHKDVDTPRQDANIPDVIDSFVAAFSANGGLWLGGADAWDQLRATSPEQVVSETLRTAKFTAGLMTSYQILDMRKVHISKFPDAYTIVLVDTNLGQMILLMQHIKGNDSIPGHWWRRIYDASPQIKRLY